MNSRADVVRAHPDFPWLDPGDTAGVEVFLRERDWIESDELVTSCAKAGEGNMNLTLRVRTDRRSVILKQARPWVEKYDHIPAPWDRSLYEQGFYERVRGIPAVAGAMPALLQADEHARAILLEDLGEASDFTTLYAHGEWTPTERDALAAFLAALHSETRGTADPEFVNRDMRLLNHEHIFVVPLAENNGVDVDAFEPGLSDYATKLRTDNAYVAGVTETGDRYLRDGECLLHGDYFPGSWLRTAKGIRVIDPEFCFYGGPEFDLGVCLAHLRLAGRMWNEAESFLDAYTQAGAVEPESEWIARYAATELMRRLLGVAQLPIAPTTGFRAQALDGSRAAMHTRNVKGLWT
jgi:5-methylthioribose kinase